MSAGFETEIPTYCSPLGHPFRLLSFYKYSCKLPARPHCT